MADLLKVIALSNGTTKFISKRSVCTKFELNIEVQCIAMAIDGNTIVHCVPKTNYQAPHDFIFKFIVPVYAAIYNWESKSRLSLKS